MRANGPQLLASVSPDGRKMVAVGDDNKVQLHSISSSGYIEKVATMAGNDTLKKNEREREMLM